MNLPLGLGYQQPERRRVSASAARKGTVDPRSMYPQVLGARIWSYCGGTSMNEFWASNCSQTVGEGPLAPATGANEGLCFSH